MVAYCGGAQSLLGWLAVALVGAAAACSSTVERIPSRGDLATGGSCAGICGGGGANAGGGAMAGAGPTGGAAAAAGSGAQGGVAQGGTGADGGSGGVGAAGGAGGAIAGPVPDFHLRDVNPSSARFDELVSPRDYLQRVSAWYFGTAT